MDQLDLWDYRRRVAELYRSVRAAGPGEAGWSRWRAERAELFRDHPQSPLAPEERESFEGLPFFPYDPAWRMQVEVEPIEAEELEVGHSGEGETRFRRLGRIRFRVEGRESSLTLYWLDTYGGGVFLPFRDATSGGETYGGGRYLLDTAKGADLGHAGRTLILDFNYAYHPSCVHSHRWSCPLAPPENHLHVAVRAGERL